MTRMTLTSPTIVARGKKRNMTVATCTSANGKPPSTIKWNTLLKGEATLQETRNPNGTVTVRSSYVVVPSRETHKQKLTCIVMYRGERITDSVVLNVQCKKPAFVEVLCFTSNHKFMSLQLLKCTANKLKCFIFQVKTSRLNIHAGKNLD